MDSAEDSGHRRRQNTQRSPSSTVDDPPSPQARLVAVSDSQSGFRAFSRRALDCISLQSNSFSVESEMQFVAREHDLTLLEVPITIHYDDKPKRPVLAHGLIVLNGLLQLMGQYRPLLFFGVPGLIFAAAGFGWGLYIVDIFRRTRQLATGYAFICVLMVIVGNMSLTMGIMLHSVRAMLLRYLPRAQQVDPDAG